MKSILISEYDTEFQSELNAKLSELSHVDIIDIKFTSTYNSLNERLILNAIILHK